MDRFEVPWALVRPCDAARRWGVFLRPIDFCNWRGRSPSLRKTHRVRARGRLFRISNVAQVAPARRIWISSVLGGVEADHFFRDAWHLPEVVPDYSAGPGVVGLSLVMPCTISPVMALSVSLPDCGPVHFRSHYGRLLSSRRGPFGRSACGASPWSRSALGPFSLARCGKSSMLCLFFPLPFS